MHPSYYPFRLSGWRASTLVELTFALGICAFCLLAIFGLLPAGLKNSRTASGQTAAASLLSMVAVDLRETPSSAGASSFFQIPIPASPLAGNPAPVVRYFSEAAVSSTSALGDSRYRVTVSFLPNQYAKMALLADVLVTWPASVAPARASGRVRTFVAFDRN